MGFTLAAVGKKITAAMYNQHANGVRLYKVASTAERDAISDAVTGDLCLVTANLITYRYNGSSWAAWSSPWISFTPTLYGMVVGSGGSAFNVSEYKFTDGDFRQRGRVVFGTSGTTFPTTPALGLPSGISLRAPVANDELLFGSVTLVDVSGPSTFRGYVRYSAALVDRVQFLGNAATAGGLASIQTTVPFTWTAGDVIEYDLLGKLAA